MWCAASEETCSSREWAARRSTLCAGANGEDDINDLQGFLEAPRLGWIVLAPAVELMDLIPTAWWMYCKESDAKAPVASAPVRSVSPPREDCSAASEVVGTLTGSHAWQWFSSGFYANLRFRFCEKGYRHIISLLEILKLLLQLYSFYCDLISFLLKIKRTYANGNVLQHGRRIQVQHAVGVAAWARPLITPSDTSPHYIWYQSSFLSALCGVEMFTGVSQGTKREMPSVGERTLAREEKIRGENKCNADKGALLIGLWAHRFRYITRSKREWKSQENTRKEAKSGLRNLSVLIY